MGTIRILVPLFQQITLRRKNMFTAHHPLAVWVHRIDFADAILYSAA
jgi:hypothetical protein